MQMEMASEGQRQLDELLTGDERRALRAQTVVLTSPTPAQAIVSYARDEAIDLIIVGTHGRTGLAHFFMGSVAEHVVRAAQCPVLTVRHPEREFTRPDALERVAATPVPAPPPVGG
jgi:nucleotide-binding universal stress UspA family protein